MLQNQVDHVFYEYNMLKLISWINNKNTVNYDINGNNNSNINKSHIRNESFSLIHHSFKDTKFIYFILDYIPGGELFTLVRKEIKFL